jgi:flagellar biosynthesis protein FlhG
MVTENNLMPSTLDVGAKKPRVIAFTSGKGGVGKTSLSVNLAIALARSGSKVCLFDADMGMANVNIMLGIAPAYTLEHLFTNERTIQDIVLTGPAGLDLVPGASGFRVS